MNVVCITGRLSQDVTVRQTANGKPVANFSVAVQRSTKNENGQYEADFFNVTCFNSTAEFAEKYLSKGIKCEISGRIQNDSWTDKDGNKRISTVIYANNIGFAESKKAAQENASQAQSQSQEKPQPQTQQRSSAPSTPPQNPVDDFMNIPDDSPDFLPFS